MDKQQRTALQKNHMMIVEDLLVTDDFLGQCFQEDLFDLHLIEIIKTERTNQQKVHKLLELLPHRGPEAFDKFVSIIELRYPWLSMSLENGLSQERQKHQENRWSSRIDQLPRLGLERLGSPSRYQSYKISSQRELCSATDVSERIENFTQRSFGLHRKLSQSDKRAVEQFLLEQIKLEVKKQNEVHSKSNDKIPPLIKQWLLNTHIKFKVHIDCLPEDSISKEELHTSYSITFEIVEKQIETLLNRIQHLEEQMTNLYDVLGETSRKKSPALLVENILHKCQDIEVKLEWRQKEIDDMSNENYEMTMAKKKLAHELQLKDVQLEVKANQISKLQQENKALKMEIEKLKKASNTQSEKEKTLTELQHIVNDLRQSRDQVRDENTELKYRLEQQRARFLSPRRQTSYSKTSNSKSLRAKAANKKRLNNR
ncbi:myosin-7-like [Saccostrea cucullata]|uniref:myosin-7-like n=1 Tax=Saccostrea cuccullata TaxID=36930 RepID=UPI002ED3B79D